MGGLIQSKLNVIGGVLECPHPAPLLPALAALLHFVEAPLTNHDLMSRLLLLHRRTSFQIQGIFDIEVHDGESSGFSSCRLFAAFQHRSSKQ